MLVAEIDAKLGGFGIVPDDLEGAIVSSHYFLFEINELKLNRKFLSFYLQTPGFQDQVTARGSTNYAAIRPRHVLDYTIPLPPLEEQNRIVAKLDALSAKIDEAQALTVEVHQGNEALCRALLAAYAETSTPVEMSELLRLREPDVTVQATETYEFAGVYSFGRGVFRGHTKQGMEFSYPKLSRLRAGDFVYPKLMAWEGALGVVPPECDGLVVSTEFPVFEVNTERVLPEVLDVHFRSPEVWPRISGDSTGTNVRRRRLKPADLLRYRFPLPPRHIQEQLRAIRQHADSMTTEQAGLAASLTALLPSLLDRAFRGFL